MVLAEKLFAFNEALVRVARTAENLLFVAVDVCRALTRGTQI